MMERLGNQFPRTLCNFTGPLDRADADILGPDAHSLADVLGTVDRMQGHQVAGTLADALRGLPNTFPCSLADVARTMADIASSPQVLGCGSRLGYCRRGRLRRRCGILGYGRYRAGQN